MKNKTVYRIVLLSLYLFLVLMFFIFLFLPSFTIVISGSGSSGVVELQNSSLIANSFGFTNSVFFFVALFGGTLLAAFSANLLLSAFGFALTLSSVAVLASYIANLFNELYNWRYNYASTDSFTTSPGLFVFLVIIGFFVLLAAFGFVVAVVDSIKSKRQPS